MLRWIESKRENMGKCFTISAEAGHSIEEAENCYDGFLECPKCPYSNVIEFKVKGDDQKRIKKLLKNQKGAVIIEMAVMMPLIIILLALFVDVGFWLWQANKLQTASNASSQAGAYYLPNEAEAEQRAYYIAQRNGYESESVIIDIENNIITVTIYEAGYSFFSGMLTDSPPLLKGEASYSGQ